MIILPWEKPKVSILLTTYNNPNFTRTLDSVLNQTYENLEVWLLDDNSDKPEVLELYEKYLKKDPRVRFYNSKIKDEDRFKETPYARQINKGLDLATGKLVCYLCDDVEYLPHKIETMVNFLKKHPKVKVCYNWQKQIWEPTGVLLRVLKPTRILRDPAYKVDHNSVMHYLGCIKKVGKWNTNPKYRIIADAVFWRKLGKRYPFYPIKEFLEIHYQSPSRFTSTYLTQVKKTVDKILYEKKMHKIWGNDL